MRAALGAFAAMLVLAVAGCGGEDVGAGKASGADQLKAGAFVYWETNSDPDSDQWKQVEELLKRFPDGDKWIAELKEEIESEGVTWEGDVEPALGDQVALAVYGGSGGNPTAVGLTKPEDPDKTLALVEKLNASDEGDDDAVTRVVGDWVFISDKASSIDGALKGDGGKALSDDSGFNEAMAELPEDSISRVYVDPPAALSALRDADGATAKAADLLGLDDIDFAGGWARARDDGAEVAGVLRGEGAGKLLGTEEEYESTLLDRVPEDAFAFFSFQGGGIAKQVETIRSNPLFSLGVREAERELGVSIDRVLRLFRGEVAFYAAPGAPIPELTLLLDADDPAEARPTTDRLLRVAAERGGGEVTKDGDVTTAAFSGFTLNLATVGDTLVLTTAKSAIAGMAEPDDKLEDSDRYKDALEAAGVPKDYTGLAYIDLSETIEVVMGFASSSGENVPPEISRNLEPLKSLVAYGTKDGDLGKSLLFVEID